MTDTLSDPKRVRDFHMHTMDLLTPAEIDTQLARIWESTANVQRSMRQDEAFISETNRQLGQASRAHYHDALRRRLAAAEGRLAERKAEHLALRAEAAPYEAEFKRRGGWNRYFIVQGGHVHRGTNCSTCYPTTLFGWLVDLADKDEAAMVAQYGHIACTVCFPTAPVEEMRRAHEAAQAAEYCAGSGRAAEGKGRHRYRTCPVCGKYIQLNESTWTLRKHKAPKKGKEEGR